MDTTIGDDVIFSVFELLKKYDLLLSKLSFIDTGGAPFITGKNIGFVED